MRFRLTAFPVFLVTVKPTRGDASSPRSSTSSRKSCPRRFSPRRTVRNSLRLRSRRSTVAARRSVSGNDWAFVRRSAWRDRGCGELRRRHGRPWWPCGHESRADACGRVSRVDRCASFLLIPRRAALLHSVASEQELCRAGLGATTIAPDVQSQRERAYRKQLCRSQSPDSRPASKANASQGGDQSAPPSQSRVSGHESSLRFAGRWIK